MRIETIAISNMLSFLPCDTNDPQHTISLIEPQSPYPSLTILIGPNGSGKSNFLRILHALFHGWIVLPCEFTPQRSTNSEKQHATLVCGSSPALFPKHRAHTHEKQQIQIRITLTELDMQNLTVLRTNKTIINNLLTRFSSGASITPSQRHDPIEALEKTITITISQDTQNVHCTFDHHVNQLLYDYIRYYRLFLYAFELLNSSRGNDEPAYEFHRSFAIIGGERSYEITASTFDTFVSPSPTYSYIGASTHNMSHIREQLLQILHAEAPIFNYVKEQIVALYTGYVQNLSPKQALQKTLKTPRLQEINTILGEFFNLKFMFEAPDEPFEAFQFYFVLTESGRTCTFRELGSGEKAMVHFLFEIFGKQLHDGILLLEEPELHVYPHLQEQFLSLLQRLVKRLGMQCLVSTHSPFFVNHTTISSLIRFQKIVTPTESYTKVYNPPSIGVKEKNLIKSLDYNVAGNIFFVDKAIMVEGPDDHYFLEHLIRDRKQTHTATKRIGNYDIFQLNGKQLFGQFRSLLAKFGLQTYYIGDRDNIGNILHIDYFPLRSELKKRNQRDDRYQIKHHYGDLVDFVRTQYPDRYSHIIQKIDQLYTRNIFILKQGSIENYVSTRKKGFEYIITFCKRDFPKRKKDPSFKEKRTELYGILEIIFD